jgi:hypothetical protein
MILSQPDQALGRTLILTVAPADHREQAGQADASSRLPSIHTARGNAKSWPLVLTLA